MNTSETQHKKMIETPVAPLITSLAIPTVISMLISAIYNLADTYFVSGLSDSATTAVSVVFSLMSLIQAIGFTLGMGCSTILSRAYGRGENKLGNKIATKALIMGVCLGLLLSIFSLIFNRELMLLLGSSLTALENAMDYSKYIIIACPFMISSFIMNNILRSEGKAKLSMFSMTLGGLLNIALDPLFIFTLNMGVAGAGLATMISQMVSFIILLSFFVFNKTNTKISFKDVDSSFKDYLQIVKEGSPTLFRQGFASISNTILNQLAKPFGDPFMAALGITAKVYMFIRNIVIGIGQGYQPVVGYNYGAKKFDRIRKAFYFTLIVTSIGSIIAAILTIFAPRTIINLFNASSEAKDLGVIAVRYLGISLPFLGFTTVVNQSLQVMGYSKSASFLASLRQGILYIPLVFILGLNLQQTGLSLTQPIADILTFLITIFFYFYLMKILKNEEKKVAKEKVIN